MHAVRASYTRVVSHVEPTPHGDPGVAGNARLTGATAVVLFLLLAAEGVTILRIRPLLSVHAFVGFLLIPPVLLKLASTGYRFIRYYSGNRRYRAAGPPQPLLRLIAPVVVLSTVTLFGTGVALWFVGRGAGNVWLHIHQISFFIWFFVTVVHVLGYVVRAPTLALADVRPMTSLPGRVTRRSLVGAAMLLGVLLALAAIQWPTPFVAFDR